MIKSFNFPTFSGMDGNGRAGGSGAFSLLGQPHSARTELQDCSGSFLSLSVDSSGCGKLELIEPRSERHNLLIKSPVSSLTTCRICLEVLFVPGIDISTGKAPSTVILLPSAVLRVTLLSNRHDRGMPNCDRMLSPAQRTEQPVSATPSIFIFEYRTVLGSERFDSRAMSSLHVLTQTLKLSVLVRVLGLCSQRFVFLSQNKSAVDMLANISSAFKVKSRLFSSSFPLRSFPFLLLDLHTF